MYGRKVVSRLIGAFSWPLSLVYAHAGDHAATAFYRAGILPAENAWPARSFPWAI